MICKKCKSEFLEKYSKNSNGDFCSLKCARSYSSLIKRDIVNEKVSKINKQKYKEHPELFKKNFHVWTDEDRKKSIPALKKAIKEKNKLKETILPFDEISKKFKKKKILNEQNGRCIICEIMPIWNNRSLTFHLDHIDGNHNNNLRENLRMICPNCHSQTETYCIMKNKKGKSPISKEDVINAVKESKNIRQTLIKLKLAPMGANYNRVQRIKDELI
jgi:hypothetical protein